ncbi:MAG: orotidine-5'-phosphate decarboxylase [Candidatus Omnitrophica bacterium]|nr:orotidine-5'-phosphate decarboxylase [Candidatus Omnitrophota bacterium]
MEAKDRLIVALDVDIFEEAEGLIEKLSSEVDIFKVGIAPFTAFGEKLLNKLREKKKKCFLDLKVHDIPNTVRNAAKRAAEKNIFMINFHCIGGGKMLEAAVEGVAGSGVKKKPILLGVTVLTSMTEEDLIMMGIESKIEEKVIEFAGAARKAGLNGVVASAKEAKKIRERFGKDFVIVTPGIRPEWAEKGDQKRVLTPSEAISEGADYLVVGRPIIQADDPLNAAKRIIKEIKSGLKSGL